MLRRYGRACGIDITWSGLAYARARGERQVARASATRLPFPAGQFDLVTSFDVLYAFDDEMERDALNEMYRVLRPGGQIVINVAALKVLTGNHSVLGGEVRRYHRRELRDHLARTGFTVLRITYTNFTLLPLVAGVRFAQRLVGHRESTAEMTVPAAPVNAALSGLLAVEAAALRRRQHAARQLAARPRAETAVTASAPGSSSIEIREGQPPAIGRAFLLAGDERAIGGHNDSAVGRGQHVSRHRDLDV